MSNITINRQSNTVPTSQSAEINTVQGMQQVNTDAGVQDIPVCNTATQNEFKPSLPPVGATDVEGAASFFSSYVEYIILMCEANRNSYEANKEAAQAEIKMRVEQLESAAQTRKNGAITGLAFSIVGGIIGIGGGIYGGVAGGINIGKLKTGAPSAQLEAMTAQMQSISVSIRAAQDVASTTGQTATSLTSANADIAQAAAEETEADRQLSISNMQQFQQLMSKFNDVLASFLDAKNKSASAAAQV